MNLAYLVTRVRVTHGLQQYAAILIDPVSRCEVYSATRWDEQMALHEVRRWAAKNNYLPTEFRGA